MRDNSVNVTALTSVFIHELYGKSGPFTHMWWRLYIRMPHTGRSSWLWLQNISTLRCSCKNILKLIDYCVAGVTTGKSEMCNSRDVCASTWGTWRFMTDNDEYSGGKLRKLTLFGSRSSCVLQSPTGDEASNLDLLIHRKWRHTVKLSPLPEGSDNIFLEAMIALVFRQVMERRATQTVLPGTWNVSALPKVKSRHPDR